MTEFTSFQLIIAVSILFLATTAMMALMFYMMNKNRESKFNVEKHRIELSLMRKNLESQVYELNERMAKDKNKWKEAHYLQLDGNNSEFPSEKPSIKLNEFLKAAGIKLEDLTKKDFVFVLTPFHNKYDDVFESIKKVCENADIRCIRGDEQDFKGDIFPHILKNIIQSRIIVANLTGRNPNVMYELGIAHALDKTTIMVSKLLDDLPVDIKSKRIVTYKDSNQLKESLLIELLKVVKDPNK